MAHACEAQKSWSFEIISWSVIPNSVPGLAPEGGSRPSAAEDHCLGCLDFEQMDFDLEPIRGKPSHFSGNHADDRSLNRWINLGVAHKEAIG